MGAFSAHARQWAIDHALPLWADAGFDRSTGLFVEKLDLDGGPVADVPRRLTVQARQIYTYAHAALLGWYPAGGDLAPRTANAMIARYHGADGNAGWLYTTAPDGTPADATRDFYAQAFALYALAWAYKLQPDPQFAVARDATLDFLDRSMAHAAGGYRAALGSDGSMMPQNPHMHLLEAMLAWWEATGEERFLARADTLVALWRTRFFQPAHGTLSEYFDAAWQPLPGERGRLCEPGHHFEWVWLLHRYAAARGGKAEAAADALYRHAVTHGHAADGRVIDELVDEGRATKPSSRCWPQTEAIKAHGALHEAGDAGAEALALRSGMALFTHFLGRPVAGGWIDQVDADGAPASAAMPATTLYHAFLAIAEANRVWPAISPR